MIKALTLAGDDNNEPMDMTEAQVNHLRRLLAWMICEYNLSAEGQQGFLNGLHIALAEGTPLTAVQALALQESERVQKVPLYIRRGIKMLSKAIREHDDKTRMLSASFKRGETK